MRSYPFVSPKIHDAFGLPADDPRRRAFVLANPLSENEPELRTSLLPGLLAMLVRNTGRGNRDAALFEMGLVYDADRPLGEMPVVGVEHRPSSEEYEALLAAVPDQPLHVAVVAAGQAEAAGWWGTGTSRTWADAVQAARTVAGAHGAVLTVRQDEYPPWHPGRCASLLLDGVLVGHAGELHPRVVAALDLPPRTVAMELDLDAFPVPTPAPTPSLSSYPPVLLDVALVVEESVAAAEVLAAIVSGGGALVESARLFDVYADPERLGEGLKSLAFSLRFRAPDRTLTIEEATAARDAAIAAAAEATGATLRS